MFSLALSQPICAENVGIQHHSLRHRPNPVPFSAAAGPATLGLSRGYFGEDLWARPAASPRRPLLGCARTEDFLPTGRRARCLGSGKSRLLGSLRKTRLSLFVRIKNSLPRGQTVYLLPDMLAGAPVEETSVGLIRSRSLALGQPRRSHGRTLNSADTPSRLEDERLASPVDRARRMSRPSSASTSRNQTHEASSTRPDVSRCGEQPDRHAA